MYQPKAGDVISWTGFAPSSIAINLVTGGLPCWPFYNPSHVGIMAEYEGRLAHFECTTLSDLPCIVQGKCAKGTQAVRLADRLATYHGKAFCYPLYRPLYRHESKRLTDFLVSRIGLPYDTLGAFESGGLVGGIMADAAAIWRRYWHIVPRRAYFCSKETIDAISCCGIWPTDLAARWNPNKLIRHLRSNEILIPRVCLK